MKTSFLLPLAGEGARRADEGIDVMQKNNILKNQSFIFCLIWLFILIIGRIIPHPPNMTPTLSLCVFGIWWLRRAFFFLYAIFAIEISDIVLAYFYGYNAIGYWTIFNASAYMLIMFAAMLLQPRVQKFFALQFFSLIACLFFWVWTNFGVWIFSELYPHNMIGLSACYVMALPFLKNALIADVFWLSVLWFFSKTNSPIFKLVHRKT